MNDQTTPEQRLSPKGKVKSHSLIHFAILLLGIIALIIVVNTMNKGIESVDALLQQTETYTCWELNKPDQKAFHYCVEDIEFYHD